MPRRRYKTGIRRGIQFQGRFCKHSKTAASSASRAVAVAAARGMNQAVRGLQIARGEFKSVDVNLNGACDTTAGGRMVLLNGMARGDDISGRNGREVVMKSIEAKFNLYVTAGTGVDQTHRVVIFYDRQANGAAPVMLDVLSAATAYAPRNLENRRRFKIIYDRTVPLNASAEAGSHKVLRFYRRLNHPTTFNAGNAGTVADITTGSFYMLFYGNIAAGATAGAATGACRMRYEDK